jgi:hypothetical protein
MEKGCIGLLQLLVISKSRKAIGIKALQPAWWMRNF